MATGQGEVCIVDDDPQIGNWLKWILETAGYNVQAFSSADQYLSCDVGTRPHCLLVDLYLPGMTGLSLCQQLRSRKVACEFIFISGSADVSSAVEAMQLGASDFLQKPFRRERLLESVHRAMQMITARYQHEREEEDFAARLASLTSREREVFDAVAAGQPTKVIAARWGISSRTIDVHRSRIMQKLGIESPMQLAHFIAMTLCLRNQTSTPASA